MISYKELLLYSCCILHPTSIQERSISDKSGWALGTDRVYGDSLQNLVATVGLKTDSFSVPTAFRERNNYRL